MSMQRCGNCRFGEELYDWVGPVAGVAECQWEPTEPVPFWRFSRPTYRVHKADDGAECAAWKERNDDHSRNN